MKSSPLFRLLCIALLVLASVTVQAEISQDSVSVHYKNPKNFSEAKLSFGAQRRDADAYLKPLKDYITRRAARILASGQRLDIVVTDVKRAGDYEPWRGPRFDDIRIIKDIYPPRIDLDFTLYGADGNVLREGSRKLRNPAFLNGISAGDQDPLRYEKSLIDLWLNKGAGKL